MMARYNERKVWIDAEKRARTAEEMAEEEAAFYGLSSSSGVVFRRSIVLGCIVFQALCLALLY